MARVFTKPMLAAEFARARSAGWDRACASAEKESKLPPGLLLAIASQETDMNDVVGDGGHGRGLFQIDDRSHTTFLRQQGANRPGGKPAVPAAAKYAAGLVRFNFDFGVKNGVPERDRLKFALSAYNAGAGGALEGFKAGDSDRRTTGGDYGKAVLGRFAIYQSLLGVAPPPVLQEGSRGKAVSEFKEALQAWYERHLPGRVGDVRDHLRPALRGAARRGGVRLPEPRPDRDRRRRRRGHPRPRSPRTRSPASRADGPSPVHS